MNKTILKLVAFLMAAFMLLPLVMACGDDEGKDTGGDHTVDTSGDYRDDLPLDLNYDREDINFVSRSFDWYKDEITVDGSDTSDIVDGAVFRREATVEDRLNVNIVNTMLDGSGSDGYYLVTEKIRTEVLSGTNDFDIGVNNMYHTMEAAAEGIFYDMNDVPNVDLRKPYYSQNYNETATVAGKLFSVVGDASLTFIKFTFATFFNRAMAENQQVGDLYQMVLDGDWTIEAQYNIVKEMHEDNNGDGQKDEGDGFGLLVNTVLGVDPYWSAFDLPIIGKDSGGKLTVELNTEKTSDVLKYIINMFYSTNGVYSLGHKSDDGELTTASEMFADDRALFMTNRLYECEQVALRDMTNPYGIIPMPKWDTDQEQYYSYTHDLMSVFVISKAVNESRLPMIGAVLECFFSESDECRYNLFEEALKIKYQSTEKTGRMLDIIIDNVVIDTGWVFAGSLNDIAQLLRQLTQNRASNVAGYWRMNESPVTKKMNTLQDTIAALE